jgi:CRISPR-associated exonuclease Cas4
MSLGILLLILAAVVITVAVRMRSESGLPPGPIVYQDTEQPGEALIAERYRIIGKPDYLIRQGRHLIPVEVKPHRLALQPYDSDVFQLAAYCLLVEETTGHPPPYGLLQYKDRTFRIPYTRALRADLLRTVRDMHRMETATDVPRSHNSGARCRGCTVRAACTQRLD